MERRKKVCFVSNDNTCRSIIAELYLRHLGREFFEVQSFGITANRVHHLVQKVMAKRDINPNYSFSKVYDVVANQTFDIIVLMHQDLNERLPRIPYNHELGPRHVLRDLLVAAMKVSDVGRGLGDDLAVQFEDDPQDAVGGRVGRPHVEHHLLAFQVAQIFGRARRHRPLSADRRLGSPTCGIAKLDVFNLGHWSASHFRNHPNHRHPEERHQCQGRASTSLPGFGSLEQLGAGLAQIAFHLLDRLLRLGEAQTDRFTIHLDGRDLVARENLRLDRLPLLLREIRHGCPFLFRCSHSRFALDGVSATG